MGVGVDVEVDEGVVMTFSFGSWCGGLMDENWYVSK